MKRRLRLAAAAVLVAAGVLAPVASGADADGTADDGSPATAQCPQGYSYDSGSGDCHKDETRAAGKSCPAAVGGHAVQVSGDDCVTVTAHTTRPTYSCNTAERWALVGDPPSCQRTVTRQVTERRTVTEMVTYTQTYTVQVKTTVTVRVPYTVQVKVSYVERVRVPPTSKQVRIPPYSETITGSYEETVRYCKQYDLEFGTGCIAWGTRKVTRTYTQVVEAFHYKTVELFNYEDQVRFRYVDEERYRDVTRTVTREETRTREVCCRPVTRTISVTRTVRDTQSAVPDASCAAAGYSMNSSSRCERPAGTRLAAVTYRCAAGWDPVSGDPANCERTLTHDPTWQCAAGRTIDRDSTPPHCHPTPDPDEDEDEEDEEDPDGDDEDEEDPDDDDDMPECVTALSTLGSGSVSRSGSWAAGCASVHKSSDQVPYYAWSYTFTITAAATLDLDAVSRQDPHVYVTASDGTVVGSDDDSGPDGRDSRIRGLKLQPGTYTIEVTTGSERITGSFTLTLKLTVAAGSVKVSGFEGAEGTPDVGEAAVTLSSGFTVSPADATCSAEPVAAAVTPASGASRTVSLSVAAATTVSVTVTCTSGSHKETATAKFKANPAPDVHDCDDPLGTLSSTKSSRTGSLGATTGCKSVRHPRSGDDRVFYASRHTFRMAAAGWVTIDLANTGSGSDRIDAYVLLLNGYTPDGAGTRLAHDDDSGPPDGRYNADSRIARRFLQPGMYTIEATTFGPRDQGTYRVTVSADYTPQITGTGQPAQLTGEVGETIRGSWTYEPASTTRLSVASIAPAGLSATVHGDEGNASLVATATRADEYTVTVAYANGDRTITQETAVTAVVVDRSCPPSTDGERARLVHHHEPGRGHNSCQAHSPPPCKDTYTNYWTPGHEHRRRNIKSCNSRNGGGIVDPELLPWSPYDIDRAGRPVFCKEASPVLFPDPGDRVAKCMELHKLTVMTWNSGFDIVSAIRKSQAENGRIVPAKMRSDLEAIQRAVDYRETILVGTGDYSRITGITALDDVFVQLLCEGVVEYGVDKGVDAAAKRVGGWAKNRFPTGTVLKGAVRLNLILGFAQTVLGVLWQNFATDAACD